MGEQSQVLEAAPVTFERRFRAVLVADVVGYTRLVEAAELETLARFRALRVTIVDPTVISHRGEVAASTGDGFVAVFESPADALSCAVQLQQELAASQTGQPELRRIVFRMGMHWDPVILDTHDVSGTGVIVAVRLQGIAPPGGVVVSSALLEQVGEKAALHIRDLGDVSLKNFSKPVHAFLISSDIMNSLSPMPGRYVSPRRLPSIAVLPFVDVSDERSDRYFAQGFADDIVITLSNLSELFVVSRGSTVAFADGPADPVKVSEKLGVRYVLKGRLRRAGARLRIWVELEDAATGEVVWTERYDAMLDDVFAVQDEITIKAASSIARFITTSEVRRAARIPPQNLNAYDHLLRGVDLLYRLDSTTFPEARALLERASEADPDYAAPYAFAAHWHMFNIAEGWSTAAESDTREIIRLTDCAIQRDPANALALAIQGHARAMFFRDHASALDLIERATTASPNSAWAWAFGSGTPGFVGDPATGIHRAERAIRLSPLDQQVFFSYCLLAQNHYLAGSYDDAIRWSRKALSLNPRFGNAVRVLAASLVATGHVASAQEIALHHGTILPRFRLSEYAARCPFQAAEASAYVARLATAGIAV